MKLKKQLAALFLSAVLLTSLAVPCFAEPEPETATTEQTADTVTDSSETTAPEEGNTTSDTTSDSSTDTTDSADTENTETNGNETTAENTPMLIAENPVTENGMPVITVDAGASLVVNGETGEMIHADNEYEKMYPASCTKILTALLTIENCKPDDVVTMEESDFVDVNNGASNAGLKVGEEITVENLLYCLLLPSGNEAANALARHTAGSVEAFVQQMNDRATELGCTNTHFVNPNGLHDDDHYTCAYDLYLMAKEAMTHELFGTIVNTAQRKLPATNMNEERVIYTTNNLILSRYSTVYYANCYGIKTGHTSNAGYCFVGYAKTDTYSYFSVILNAKGAQGDEQYAGSFTETYRMFDWAFDNFRMKTATSAGSAVTERTVRLGRGTDHITLVTAADVNVLLPKGVDASEIEISISAEDSYDAPIAKGDKLGTVTYSYNGMDCATADLIALSEVERSTILFVLDKIAQLLRITAVRVILIVLVVLFVLYFVLNFISSRNRRIRKAKKRKRAQNKNRRSKH